MNIKNVILTSKTVRTHSEEVGTLAPHPHGPDKKSPISLIRLSGPGEALSSIDERLQMSAERDARVLTGGDADGLPDSFFLRDLRWNHPFLDILLFLIFFININK